ncbi:Fc.00g061510.m01.CDS01 [Cosmosporella sp. VM-42]
MVQRLWYIFRWAHLWLSVTTVESITLLVCSFMNIHIPSDLNSAITSNQPSVQAVIQVAVFILAFLQTAVIGELSGKLIFRHIRGKSIKLESLDGWAAIGKGTVCKKPFGYLICSLIWIVHNVDLPTALLNSLQVWWTGALTPEADLRQVVKQIQIPYYTEDLEGLDWNRTVVEDELPVFRQKLGAFSYSPIRTMLGSILDTAAVATSPDNATQTFRKLDNTGYRYINRSYGAGASVGFDRRIENETRGDLETYHFVEPENIDLPGRRDDSQVVALLGNPHNGRYGWGIVTGDNARSYQTLNLTFCEVIFERRDFRVEVLPGQRLINVTVNGGALRDTTTLGPAWNELPGNVVRQVGMIVQTSNSGIFSPLGNALVSNINQTILAQKNQVLPDNSLDETEISLLGITRALEAMVDHILVGIASAQYMIPGPDRGRKEVDMTASYKAFKIGNRGLIWTVFALNCGILLAFLCVKYLDPRDKGDHAATQFDWCEPTELILRTSLFGESNYRFLDDHPNWGPSSGDLKDVSRSDTTLIKLGEDNSGFQGFVLENAPDAEEERIELLSPLATEQRN